MIYATFVLKRFSRVIPFQVEIPTFIVTDALSIANAFRLGVTLTSLCDLEIEGISLKKTRGIPAFPMSKIPNEISNVMHPDWPGDE